MREAKFGQILYWVDLRPYSPLFRRDAYQESKSGMIGLSKSRPAGGKGENGIRNHGDQSGAGGYEILEKRPVKPSAEMLAQAVWCRACRRNGVGVRKVAARAR